MRGRRVLQTIHWKPPERSLLCVLLLAGFFLVGAFVGFQFSGACDPSAQRVLREYLHDFCTVLEAGEVEFSLPQSAALYFSYLFAVFLLGFSSLGILLIPLLSALFGFGTAFTIACFVETFARAGIYPALALLSLRLLFTLTSFLILAGEAVPQSGRIALMTLKRGRQPVFRGNRYFVLLAIGILFLLVGLCCEKLLTPMLFRLAMKKINVPLL